MDALLASYVVKSSCQGSTPDFTSRVGEEPMAYNSGLYVYLSLRGRLVYELGNWQSPSRGDRANCDVTNEFYLVEGYPHVHGTRIHSMVE